MTEIRKIKIMQITHDLNIGGLQRLVVDISKKLDRSRYQVSVCTLREGGQLEDELLKDGINVIKLSPLNGIDYLTFWKLYVILRKERPDIIHTHNTQPFVEGGIAAKMAHITAHIHTDHGRQFPDKRRYMFAEWALSHFVDQIVAVSENLKNDISKYEKINPEKIKVVINGIDEEKFKKKVDKEKKMKEIGILNSSSPILGFVGRLSPEKGITYLIKAMKPLIKEFPNILLLIAGEGYLLKDLRKESSELDTEHNIRFLGPRSDIHEILGILDIFVLPSLREGLPLVLLEAAAAALPIVVSDVGGVRQVVNDGINGLIVEPQDVNGLYSAIRQLAINNKMRKEFGNKSLDLFENNFTIDKMMRKYDDIYQTCLKDSCQRMKAI